MRLTYTMLILRSSEDPGELESDDNNSDAEEDTKWLQRTLTQDDESDSNVDTPGYTITKAEDLPAGQFIQHTEPEIKVNFPT